MIVGLSIIVFGLTGFLAVSTIIALLYPWLYRRFYLPHYAVDYTPEVGIFVPCKGLDLDLAQNLISVAEQDYPHYTVTYVTESAGDAANPVIEQIVAAHPHTQHIIAGLAENNCQKNHNILGGMAQDRGSEVYVFCDSDVRAAPTWLHDLVRPLSSDKVAVTCGFRLISPPEKSFATTFHAMLNSFLRLAISSPIAPGVWGGAMAIKRAEFERMRVREQWSRTVVDDISLMQLLMKYRAGTVFVPSCVSVTNEAIPTLDAAMKWFTRQGMYLKLYARPFWIMLIALYLILTVILLGGPAVLIVSWFIPALRTAGRMMTSGAVLLMLNYGLMKRLNPDNQDTWFWIVASPVMQLLAFYAGWQTVGSYEVHWRGVTYRTDKRGYVTEIIRTRKRGEKEI